MKSILSDYYLSVFEAYERDGLRRHPEWLQTLQRKAIAQFVEQGFPTTRDENWKYTDVEPYLRTPFDWRTEAEEDSLGGIAGVDPFLASEGGGRIVFINGRWSRKLSVLPVSRRINVSSLREALTTHSKILEEHLGHGMRSENGFTSLNTAFVEDGAFVYIPEECIEAEPIHLIFVADSRKCRPMIQPRNLIHIGKGSQVAILEHYVSQDSKPYLTNALTEVFLDEDARIDYYKIQNEGAQALHIGTTQVALSRCSQWNSYVVSTGALLGRTSMCCSLNAEKACCELNGLSLASDHQLLDHFTVMDHMKPQGKSEQLYKGLLDGDSKTVFNGKIYVRSGADGTDANQTNKNLILSQRATADTRPQLEILANDVKCTHGAAVGQLDEEELFYLKSRGIPDERARSLLMYGFAYEVVNRIKISSIRAAVDKLLSSKFKMAEGLERVL